jgi:hemolysin activation/secretion protein
LSGKTIGRVVIERQNIFDLANPEENKSLFRLANRLHVLTRDDTIRSQLLFESGDELSEHALEESARLLRQNRYLHEATISAVPASDGVADVYVTTTDVWTLIPKIDFSRSGGENTYAFGLKEANLLGTGMAVELSRKSDVDRYSSRLKVVDNNLGGSRYVLDMGLSDNSDGHFRSLALGKPFFSLGSRHARGVNFRDDDYIDTWYERGEEIADFRHKAARADIHVGWSGGLRDGWTKRITSGFVYDDNEFQDAPNSDYPTLVIPEDRTLAYPFIALEWLEDRFEKTSNINQIGRTEDRFMGRRFTAMLGVATDWLGSDRDALLLNASAQAGFGSSKQDSIILVAGLDTRIEDGDAVNLMLDFSAQFFRKQSDKRLAFLSLSGTYGHELDLENRIVVGGESGLRGYPLRYQSGNRRVLFTAEQRFFSDWYPFRLFHVGAAIFYDVGRAWGDSPVSSLENEWLHDAGFGLRLGHSRFGFGRVTHIDIAFPLNGDDSIDDVQLLLSTKQTF